jgi:hypothetical protein
MDYKDMQLGTPLIDEHDATHGCPCGANAGEVELSGLEAELLMRPVSNLPSKFRFLR